MSAVLEKRGIPTAWDLVALGDLGQWSGGGTPSKSKEQYWDGGTIPWVSPKDMKTLVIRDSEDHITEEAVAGSTAKLIPANSVLFVTRSGILRHSFPVAVNAVPVTVNQDLKTLTPKEGVLPEYVAWALRAFSQDILNTCSKQGTTVNSIETNSLKAFTIPVASLEQQERIVAEIEKQFSRLDEAVANLKRVKANLKRYKAAVLKAAVEGQLTEEWRKAHPDVEPASKLLDRILAERRAKWEEAELAKMEAKGKAPTNDKWKARYKEPVAPHVQAPDSLPEGWAWASVDQLGAAELNPITDGPFGSNLKTAHYTNEGPRVIRLQNIGNAEFLDEKAHISEEHYEKLNRHAVEGGDVIIAAMGRPAPRACLAPKTLGKAIVKADCIRFRAAHEQADPTFLMYALNSHPTQQRTESVVHGVGRPRLNLGEIKSIGLPLPPISEQRVLSQEIERQLSVLKELETEVEAQMQRSEGLRQSILKGAFTGALAT